MELVLFVISVLMLLTYPPFWELVAAVWIGSLIGGDAGTLTGLAAFALLHYWITPRYFHPSSC